MTKNSDAVIGYSGFETFEQCYGYNENSCFIADSEAAAHNFMLDAACGEFRIEPVTLVRIMDDYGCSVGKFAMEMEAFGRFRKAANASAVRFEANVDQDFDDLMAVKVEGVKIHDD